MSINESIGCTVNQCKYHAENKNYCTLDKINVSTHESDPTQIECTDCASFEKKSCCCSH